MTNNETPTTVEHALRQAAGVLRAAGIERARVDAEILLAVVLGARRLDLLTSPERPLDPPQAAAFDALVRRRAGRYPLPYLTGEREFMGLRFLVNEHVLIPRPETETLVEAAVETLRAFLAGSGEWESGRVGEWESGRVGDLAARTVPPRPDGSGEAPDSPIPPLSHSPTLPLPHSPTPTLPHALDIGTGSGAIAVSVARQVPEAVVYATDLSAEACAVARENARRLGVDDRVCVFEGDLLAPLEPMCGPQVPPEQRAAVLCANLPYIPDENLGNLQAEVRDWEPRLALAGGPGGLHIIERLVAQAPDFLRPGGRMLLEIGPEARQSERLVALLEQAGGWRGIRVLHDLAGLPRVVSAVRPPGALPERGG